jgi:hypothetical protein
MRWGDCFCCPKRVTAGPGKTACCPSCPTCHPEPLRRHTRNTKRPQMQTRPTHEARHRRGQPRRPALRTRRHLVPRRPGPAPDRHDLRPVRRPRPRALVLRHVRRRPVDPHRHAVRRHARPRGGAHQSINTPSIGIEQAECIAWEPAFGQDLEWTFLHALSRLGQTGGTSSYFRLTTRPIDQALSPLPVDPDALAQRRADVLAGGYRLTDGGPGAQVTLVGVGAVMPEVIEAARIIEQDIGHAPHVVCLTSPRPRLPRHAGPPMPDAGTDGHPRPTVPRGSPHADHHRHGRPPAHAELPRRHRPHPDHEHRRGALRSGRVTLGRLRPPRPRSRNDRRRRTRPHRLSPCRGGRSRQQRRLFWGDAVQRSRCPPGPVSQADVSA